MNTIKNILSYYPLEKVSIVSDKYSGLVSMRATLSTQMIPVGDLSNSFTATNKITNKLG